MAINPRSPKWRLYQSKAAPVLNPDSQITQNFESRWHQPWSEPVRQKIAPALAIALVSSGLFYTVQPPTASAQVAPASISSDVIFPKSIIYQSHTEPVLKIETITVDKWTYPWSEPIRIKNLPASEQQFIAFVPVVSTATQQVFNTTVSSEVVFPRSIIYQSHAEPVKLVSETITVDKWFVQFQNPVRSKAGLSAQLQQSLAFTALIPSPARFLEGWQYPWSEPKRNYLYTAALSASGETWSTFTPAAAVTTAIAPMTASDAVTFPRSIIYQAHTEPVKPPTAAAAPTFFQNVGDSGLTFQKTIIYQVSAEVSLTVNAIAWDIPLSEPVRTRAFSAALQQTIGYGNFTPTPAVVPPDSWFSLWSEPVRQKPRIAALSSSGGTWGVFTPVVVVTPAIEPMTISDSVIFPRSIIYQAHTEPVNKPAVVTVPTFFQNVGDTGLTFQKTIIYQVSAEVSLTINSVAWDIPLSEPVRTRVFSAALQQTLGYGNFTPTPVVISDTRWFSPWSEPVRTKKFSTALQQSLIYGNFTPTIVVTPAIEPMTATDAVMFPRSFIYQSKAEPIIYPTLPRLIQWFRPLEEPVRLKPGLRAYLQQTTTADTTVIPTSKIPNWLYPWSEPVRQKPGLAASLQQTAAPTSPIYPILTRLIQWFRPLEEPVRQKVGFRAWLQQFFTIDTKPIAAQVSLVMNATETNRDVASFGIVVYNRAVKCKVSIKEIRRRDDGAASIIES